MTTETTTQAPQELDKEALARAAIEEGQAPSALAQRYGLQLTRIRDSVTQVARDKNPALYATLRAGKVRVGMKTLAQHAEAFGWHPRVTLGMILSLCTQPGVRQD